MGSYVLSGSCRSFGVTAQSRGQDGRKGSCREKQRYDHKKS